MSVCNKHFKEFEAENAKSIIAFKVYIKTFKATSIREHLLENFVCKAMQRMRPAIWVSFRDYLNDDGKNIR